MQDNFQSMSQLRMEREEAIEEESSLCPTSSSPATKELFTTGQDITEGEDLSISAYAQ